MANQLVRKPTLSRPYTPGEATPTLSRPYTPGGGMGRSGPFIPLGTPEAAGRPAPTPAAAIPRGRAGVSGMLAAGGMDAFLKRLQDQLGEGPVRTGSPGGSVGDADPGAGGRYGGINPGGIPALGGPDRAKPKMFVNGRAQQVARLPFKEPEPEAQPGQGPEEPPAPPASPPGSDDAFEELAEDPGASAGAVPRPTRQAQTQPPRAPIAIDRSPGGPPLGSDDAFEELAEDAPPTAPSTENKQKPWEQAGFKSRQHAAVAAQKAGWTGDPISQLNQGLEFLKNQGGNQVATKPMPIPQRSIDGMLAGDLGSITGGGLQAPPSRAPSRPGGTVATKPMPIPQRSIDVGGIIRGGGAEDGIQGLLGQSRAGQNFLERLEALGISDVAQGIELARSRPDSILGRMFANSGADNFQAR